MTYRGVNALAETVNGYYKAELIRGPGQGPWRTVDDVELATLGWVHWWALHPLMWSNVTAYGTFDVDLEQRHALST